MPDTQADGHGPAGARDATAAPGAKDSALSLPPWRRERERGWDLVQVVTPWLLLTVSTTTYLAWGAWTAGHRLWPEVTTVLGLVAAAALWVLWNHSLPTLRGRASTVRPARTTVYFIGLLALCFALMTYSEVFLIFTITGFFHAYLLRPWQLGMLGVLGTSVAINGMTMRVWADPDTGTITMFVLVVMVQSAAIGAGILLSARSDAEELKREELVTRLEEALHENAGLHAQLVVQARESGAQDERQRLAREIHDTLAQGLAGIITQLQAAQGSARDPRSTDQHVDHALQLARTSLTEARRSLRALAPEELGRAHLPDALRTLTTRWAEQSGTRVRVEVTGDRVPLSPAIEVSLFRVTQESLTNVAKHARASRVGVTLSFTGSEVLLDVRDDGQGFGSTTGSGFGLTSMRQRIRGVGGHVDVQSAPGEGTSVSARVPAIAPGDSTLGDADPLRDSITEESRTEQEAKR